MLLVISALFLRRCLKNKKKNKIEVMKATELVDEEAPVTERKMMEEEELPPPHD